MIRIKIGDVTTSGITLEKAREKALEYQLLVASKKDPRLVIARQIETDEAERMIMFKP